MVHDQRRRATSRARSRTPLPIWIGGSGEKRTLRIAARFADGWNVPFVDPATFAAKRDVLHRHCADVGRDPAEIRCAVNVGLAWTEDSLRQQFGNIADFVRPGVLGGTVGQVVDRIGEYVDAGADQVNLALRAPFDVDALEQFSNTLEPQLNPVEYVLPDEYVVRACPAPDVLDRTLAEQLALLRLELLRAERAAVAHALQLLELRRHVGRRARRRAGRRTSGPR